MTGLTVTLSVSVAVLNGLVATGFTVKLALLLAVVRVSVQLPMVPESAPASSTT
ncbi:hypothetical protein D3C78_1667170 [compost metagenome]